ncbi:MAG: hypothetical protein A4E36_01404 [Methanoregulaceae archaeon PtaB.Bin009]|nr:MAG: hypothetical protein A4E36_01404 [Methanoregulaceae archaeon PtaB.Bin009]
MDPLGLLNNPAILGPPMQEIERDITGKFGVQKVPKGIECLLGHSLE